MIRRFGRTDWSGSEVRVFRASSPAWCKASGVVIEAVAELVTLEPFTHSPDRRVRRQWRQMEPGRR